MNYNELLYYVIVVGVFRRALFAIKFCSYFFDDFVLIEFFLFFFVFFIGKFEFLFV